uniref:Secreted protein n=1 Tax=Timema genevievae TaxID=629358 RepID=A0A7R9PT48_TIMGE|nr:unnamed protein product [Timema genevievae]
MPLLQMDHLLILAHSGQTLACLCGDFQQEWLPISVRSWSALRVIYSLAHHTWTTKGFTFTAMYAFNTDEVCGHNILTETAVGILSVYWAESHKFNSCHS